MFDRFFANNYWRYQVLFGNNLLRLLACRGRTASLLVHARICGVSLARCSRRRLAPSLHFYTKILCFIIFVHITCCLCIFFFIFLVLTCKEGATLNFSIFVFAIIVLFVVYSLTDQYLKKRFSIQKTKGWIYHPVNRLQKYGEIFLFIIALILFFSFSDQIILIMLIFLIISNGFRALMEWLYRRKTGRYLLEISATVFTMLLLTLGIACHITG
ncbi:DUF4181 domain-containing protein [Sporolactobacillus spathodeae]